MPSPQIVTNIERVLFCGSLPSSQSIFEDIRPLFNLAKALFCRRQGSHVFLTSDFVRVFYLRGILGTHIPRVIPNSFVWSVVLPRALLNTPSRTNKISFCEIALTTLLACG